MFKQVLQMGAASSTAAVSSLLRYQTRSRCTAAKHKWDLMAAVCVERHPLITKPQSELENEFQSLLNQIEVENSMKSDHEMRFETEQKQKELLKKSIVEIDPDKIVSQTAQDIEDAGDAELAKFSFASRITEADKKNITSSVERKLEKCLLLLVQQKIGDNSFWLPPQGLREDGETLRQCADRILFEACGNEFNAKIYGNAPIGFYKYVYPKELRAKGSWGVKIFYYLAKYQSGSVSEKVNYQWLDRHELEKNLPPLMHKSVSMFLVPE